MAEAKTRCSVHPYPVPAAARLPQLFLHGWYGCGQAPGAVAAAAATGARVLGVVWESLGANSSVSNDKC